MDIRKLEVFCKVVELKSFTKAAEASQLSQPTVSDHIRSLEEEFGSQLVNRLGREVEATPVGQILHGYATRILKLKLETVQAIAQHGGQFIGNLLVGASTIPGTHILPGIIGSFRRHYPDVKVLVPITGSQTVAKRVLDGDYDLGLVGAIWNERGLDWRPVFEDTLVLVARPDNDLVSDQRLGFRDVLAQAFVGREQGSGTRQVIARFLETSGLRETDLQEVAQFGSNEAVKEAVKAGVGVAILSRWSVVEELAQGTLIALPLHDFSGKRPFYLVTRKKRTLPPSAQQFVEHLLAAAAPLASPQAGKPPALESTRIR